MKRILLPLLLALAAANLRADDENWLTDLDKAKAQAKKENKLVFMDFTGSDWCPPCKQLHSTVLTSKEFTTFAKDNLVLVVVDFPRRKEQSAELKKANQKLQTKFGIEGYPTVVVLDASGKELSKESGFNPGTAPKDYVAKLEKLRKK